MTSTKSGDSYRQNHEGQCLQTPTCRYGPWSRLTLAGATQIRRACTGPFSDVFLERAHLYELNSLFFECSYLDIIFGIKVTVSTSSLPLNRCTPAVRRHRLTWPSTSPRTRDMRTTAPSRLLSASTDSFLRPSLSVARCVVTKQHFWRNRRCRPCAGVGRILVPTHATGQGGERAAFRAGAMDHRGRQHCLPEGSDDTWGLQSLRLTWRRHAHLCWWRACAGPAAEPCTKKKMPRGRTASPTSCCAVQATSWRPPPRHCVPRCMQHCGPRFSCLVESSSPCGKERKTSRIAGASPGILCADGFAKAHAKIVRRRLLPFNKQFTLDTQVEGLWRPSTVLRDVRASHHLAGQKRTVQHCAALHGRSLRVLLSVT